MQQAFKIRTSNTYTVLLHNAIRITALQSHFIRAPAPKMSRIIALNIESNVAQVLGPLLLSGAGTVWVVGAVLLYRWRRRVRRRERAARLRNRVQLHAFAIDVLKRRPQPGDPLAPEDRQQLLEHLRLLDAWFGSSSNT